MECERTRAGKGDSQGLGMSREKMELSLNGGEELEMWPSWLSICLVCQKPGV